MPWMHWYRAAQAAIGEELWITTCHKMMYCKLQMLFTIVYCSEPTKRIQAILGNLQYRLQDVRVPTLGALQHEGKSAHILSRHFQHHKRAGEKDASQIAFSRILFRFLKELEYVDELLTPDISCCVSLGFFVSSYKRGLMPQIIASNFIAHDPLAFEIVLAFPCMVRCKQFSELSSDENLQCKNL